MSSVLMKDGANVDELGVPLLESLRLCRGPLPDVGAKFAAIDATVDWVRLWAGGVVALDSGDGEEKTADLGRPAVPVPVPPGAEEGEPARVKGLFRR